MGYRLHYEVHLDRIERCAGVAEEVLAKECRVFHGIVVGIVIQIHF
jgi:hypothetical protein